MKVHALLGAMLYCTTIIHTEGQQSQLSKFLQPDDVEDSDTFSENPLHCTRECVKGDRRICYYQFYAENYATLSGACMNCTGSGASCDLPQCITADGFERGVLSVNRRIPGPSIQVCQGDRIVVDLINRMSGRSITIHWHGIFQNGTPYYDGVPMVTQCAVIEDNQFRYDFPAKQQGTFFWHSHDGVQKVDGLQGSIVIRRPKEEDPNGHLYDEDLPSHVVTIMDWFHRNSDEHFPGLITPDPVPYATYFLINGKGRYEDPDTGITTKSPYAEFRVIPGKRYRFRVIGATCDNCYTTFSVEGHRLTLIATDGNAVKPVEVDNVEISSGERYDFVINANQEVKSYWMEVRGKGLPCASINNYQLAILKYEGSNDAEPATVVQPGTDFNEGGVDLNPVNSTCNNGNDVCVAQLQAIEGFDERVLNPVPDVSFTMKLGYYFPTEEELFQTNTFNRYIHPAGVRDLVPFMNNISYTEAKSPLLSQRNEINPDSICPLDKDGFPYCARNNCRCTHVLKVPLNALVQVIMIDKSIGGGLDHPIHLHGFAFNVMSMGYMRDMKDNPKNIEEFMKTNISFSPAPALKDTVTVPSRGYTVVRFIADNP
ncbi:hypothetical protein L9F63_001215, partial [Diploptera punctata]